MKPIQALCVGISLLIIMSFANGLFAQTTYKLNSYNGQNKWSNPASWENGKKPPSVIPAGSQDIIIIEQNGVVTHG